MRARIYTEINKRLESMSCWKPLRYEVSSCDEVHAKQTPKHTPEANPEAYLRSIPPRQTFQWGYGISRRTKI